MPRPIISVFINTYNHEQYIEQALVSALEQDFPAAKTEILVVDDGSTDDTPTVIRKFANRVRYLRKENGGQVSAYNAALHELHGEIVAFLDGDDWWTKGKLTAVAEAFETNPKLASVGHGYYEVYEPNPPQEMVVPDKTCVLDLSDADAARLAAAGGTFLVTSRLSARRRVLEQIGPLPDEAVFFDTLIFTLSFALGGAFVLEKPLCYYRHHTRSLHNPLSIDAATERRRMEALGFRLRYLPPRLSDLAVRPECIEALFEGTRSEYDRARIHLGEKQGRWVVFRTESRRFHANYQCPSLGYMLFRAAVCACTLILPPSRFYRLLDWYGRNDLKRFRKVLGTPQLKVPPTFVQRRPAFIEVPEPAHGDAKRE